jgi:hypothetical protein
MSARDVWGVFSKGEQFFRTPKRVLETPKFASGGGDQQKESTTIEKLLRFGGWLDCSNLRVRKWRNPYWHRLSSFLGGISFGLEAKYPHTYPQNHQIFRTKMDDSGQQKTRFPCGIAGLYVKPDGTGRTTGGDAGNWAIDHQITYKLLRLFAFTLWVRFFMHKFSTQLFCLIRFPVWKFNDTRYGFRQQLSYR